MIGLLIADDGDDDEQWTLYGLFFLHVKLITHNDLMTLKC